MTDTLCRDRLSRLQRDIISLLAEIGSDFFLSGGIVLAGWILRHRRTDDLDLFTESDAAIASADRLARHIADKTGCMFEAIQSAPDFRRFLFQKKDAGITPATVAWILSTYRIPDELPANVSKEELLLFTNNFEKRMRNLARPSP